MPARISDPASETVWIYARVSSDKRKGRSVQQQIDECTQWCNRDGFPIANVLVDNDKSASRHAKKQRDDWELLKQAIALGKMTIVMYWEASRATRDLLAYAQLREQCLENNVYLAYGGTIYDMDDPDDRFRTGMDMVISENESDRTRKRVMRDVIASAAAGKPSGRLPYGYKREYDPTSGQLLRQVPDPVKAALVREAASRFLSGESTRAIAQDWNQRGIPTSYQPKDEEHKPAQFGWRLEQVKRIIINPAVNGKRVHQGKVVGDAEWEPILDDLTYAKVKARFDDPSRRTSRPGRIAKLLTGVARCGVCGGPMAYQPSRAHTEKPRRIYSCRYKGCTARDMDQLDSYVESVLFGLVEAGGISDDSEQDALAIHQSRERIFRLKQQLSDAVDQFTSLAISATTMAKVEQSLNAQIREAERALKVTNLPTSAIALAETDDIEAYWGTRTPEEKREIIRGMLEVVVHPVVMKGQKKFDPTCVTVTRRR